MNYRFILAITFAPLAICCGQSTAKDRSAEEFQAYAARRMAKVDEKQLAAFTKLVDLDDDGTISDAEFAKRIDAYQKVFRSVQPKHSKRGHGLPENWLTDFDKAREASQKSGKPIVAMFSASWCGPCKSMIANVYPTDEAMAALKDFVPVYIDSEEKRELASENDIRAFPTFICFNTDGESVEQKVGGGGVEKFVQMLGDFKTAAKEENEDQ